MKSNGNGVVYNIKQTLKGSRLNVIRKRIKYNLTKKKIQYNVKSFIEKKYEKCFGELPDLDNPKTFNEKVLWIALNYRNPLYTQCADKIEVKKYVVNKLGKDVAENLFCQCYGEWDNVDEIDFETLPEKFVLKPNHASGYVVICDDKTKLNINKTKRDMRSWLDVNFYYITGEWQYKDIKPKIICEKLLEMDIVDYRIFCFEGVPTYIKTTRHNSETQGGYDCAIYDGNWNKVDFKMAQNYGDMDIERPKQLDYMLDIARKLSEDFHFVRVDLYSIEDEVRFAELTFTPNAGGEKYDSMDVDRRFGSMFSLPDDNYVNKEL